MKYILFRESISYNFQIQIVLCKSLILFLSLATVQIILISHFVKVKEVTFPVPMWFLQSTFARTNTYFRSEGTKYLNTSPPACPNKEYLDWQSRIYKITQIESKPDCFLQEVLWKAEDQRILTGLEYSVLFHSCLYRVFTYYKINP